MTASWRSPRFNEAAGIHRRKRTDRAEYALQKPSTRFNEAAGIHRRKPAAPSVRDVPRRSSDRFNEAAGIHRRKRRDPAVKFASSSQLASMRPPEFTGGNDPR